MFEALKEFLINAEFKDLMNYEFGGSSLYHQAADKEMTVVLKTMECLSTLSS